MKQPATNNTGQVNEFMKKLDHPFKKEIEALRTIIKQSHPAVAEQVKWNAPSFFCEGGKDKGGMATIHVKETRKIMLIFHNGAILKDPSGIMEGNYTDRRMVYFNNSKELDAKKSALQQLVKDWVALMQS